MSWTSNCRPWKAPRPPGATFPYVALPSTAAVDQAASLALSHFRW
jgi:hypothetical protein